MYYVIYKKNSNNKYLNEDGEWSSYDEAEKFNYPHAYMKLPDNAQWVGPCEEGKEPV